MSSFSVRKRNNEAGDATGVVCNHRDLPAVVWSGHKKTSQCEMCGKLPGVKENLLAVCGYGSGDDCGIYGGESRKEEIREKVSQKFCGGERAKVTGGICVV